MTFEEFEEICRNFRRRYLIIKKTDSENVPTQIHDVFLMLALHSNSVIIHRGNVLYLSNES